MENPAIDQTTDNTPKKTTFKASISMGVMVGFVLIIYYVIIYLANMYTSEWTGWLSYCFLLIGMILGVKNYRDKDLSGSITFGQAFSLSFYIGVISGIMYIIFSFIFMTLIAPDIITNIQQMARKSMESKGMTDEQINQAMQVAHFFYTPVGILIFIVVFWLIFDVILSLLVALIMRRESKTLNYPQ
jgi:hypothetical protein